MKSVLSLEKDKRPYGASCSGQGPSEFIEHGSPSGPSWNRVPFTFQDRAL